MDSVTNQQIYETMNAMRKEVRDDISLIRQEMTAMMNDHVKPLELWRENITGRMAVIGAALIILSNVVVDWIKQKLFNN